MIPAPGEAEEDMGRTEQIVEKGIKVVQLGQGYYPLPRMYKERQTD